MIVIKRIVLFVSVFLQISYAFAQNKREVEQKERTIALEEVVIKQKRKRFEYKGDSLIINLHTDDARPHASAKTLFEKVQGLTIDWGDNISIHGKPVTAITIDGKTIFGGLPALTLDNIKADMIERMEFIETTDASGKTQSTLNLKLKEDRKNGGFGNIGAGFAPNARYSVNGNFSKITSKGFFNVFSSANNINEKGIDSKTIDRLLMTNFRNSINRASSVIGLYDPPKESFVNEINKLSNNVLVGRNKVFDNGLNYTFQNKKIEFNGFVYGSILTETNNQHKIDTRFLGTNTQKTNEVSDKLAPAKHIIGNTYLTYNPTDRLSIRFSDQIKVDNNRLLYNQNIESSFSDSTLQNVNNIHTEENNQQKFENIFQTNAIHKGKKTGVIASVYYQNRVGVSTENVDFSNESLSYLQKQSNTRRNNQVYHLLQLNYSKPISRRILLEGKARQVFEDVAIKQTTKFKNNNALVDINYDNIQTNKLTELTLFALYKRRRLDIISGVSYWHWDIKRLAFGSNFSSEPTFIVNPFTRIEYRIPNLKFAIKYAKEPMLPTWQQTISTPDSSNLYDIKTGNPALSFYTQKGLDFSVNSGIEKGYNFGLQVSYKRYDDYIISENTYLPLYGVFSSRFTNTDLPNNSLHINLNIFRINPGSNFSWFLASGIARIKLFQKTQDMITVLNTTHGFLNLNTAWKVNTAINFKTQLNSQINILQGSIQTNNTLISKFSIEIGKKSYFDTQVRIQSSKSNTYYLQSFIDFEAGKFLLKNNGLKLSIIVKNLLNNKNEIMLSQMANTSSITYNSCLPLSIIGKITIYPEVWH
ncbi:hypothetical protein [Emticicia fluvialis]|uniref:hypothetical protein n=1 Tax=Emticicia fluvialis TaxID=2974474 RepID=UPI0021658EEA|nr:hypothetical protein [Emticicia fluvialis]